MLKNIIKSVLKKHITESLINQDGSLGDLTQDDINEILRGYIDCALWTEEERLEDESTHDIDDEDYEDMDEIEKLIKKSSQREETTEGDYSNMSKSDLQKLIDKSLDEGDFETLRKIQPLMKESLEWKIYESEIKKILR